MSGTRVRREMRKLSHEKLTHNLRVPKPSQCRRIELLERAQEADVGLCAWALRLYQVERVGERQRQRVAGSIRAGGTTYRLGHQIRHHHADGA